MDDRFEPRAERIADQERKIQAEIDAKAGEGGEDSDKAVQAGARRYPEPPFPEQHQSKPGNEAALDPAPLYDAPFWKGSGKLEGMAAIITGADSGIGRAVAVLFAREGCDVAICHLDEEEDAADTKAAVEAEGRKAIVLKGDAADPAFSEAAVKAALDAFGRLDVVVPNAAFQEHVEALEDLTLEHFDRTLKTNLYGYFHLVKAAVPHLKAGGSIVMTGSVTGIMGNDNLLDYSMTKGGIHAFARSLGTHLAPRGIRVNVVAPGPVWTPLNPADRQADKVAQFGAQTVMKRPAQPEEIAPAFVFLASPQMSSYITGEVLPVIGGYSGG
ncbi:MAG: SDR family oxidoreductase [Alphaproteobacteria bacterium]|jgi:NAD(P)-dependent dehydrogenase (short-subunit alcohol dehydrogenase family)|nr:SDR family oxidoreductase [Alphaproteobacteria bacterium]MBU2041637.1 SDR family oxidoreductase [Alphaproteobacteria bacterium]MBU2126553.1 SDR family oxidoreductase [Alphaproteobacteria bacterium]MBU2208673.1 SDR family oxidoreductase [Alphaproteobacteria bacterium]MBU2291051.1 SDR family oxidoreductase [Alphaproteobacteria bacterium]